MLTSGMAASHTFSGALPRFDTRVGWPECRTISVRLGSTAAPRPGLDAQRQDSWATAYRIARDQLTVGSANWNRRPAGVVLVAESSGFSSAERMPEIASEPAKASFVTSPGWTQNGGPMRPQATPEMGFAPRLIDLAFTR